MYYYVSILVVNVAAENHKQQHASQSLNGATQGIETHRVFPTVL